MQVLGQLKLVRGEAGLSFSLSSEGKTFGLTDTINKTLILLLNHHFTVGMPTLKMIQEFKPTHQIPAEGMLITDHGAVGGKPERLCNRCVEL